MEEHVLVPIDGSAESDAAFEFAIEHHPDGVITVLHVISPTEGLVGDGDVSYVNQQTIDSAMKRGENLCERAREQFESRGHDTRTTFDSAVRVGRPATTIVEFAEENDVDHIVMGSEGRSGVARVLLGSVAETVVRRAPVPVTVVR